MADQRPPAPPPAQPPRFGWPCMDGGYIAQVDQLSRIRRLKNVELQHSTQLRMNFRNYRDGYDDYYYNYYNGGPPGHLPPPPPPPAPAQQPPPPN